MAYDLEEQEQIAQFKAFWQQWGNLIVGAVLVCVLAYGAWQGYGWYQKRQIVKAEAVFTQLNNTIEAKQDAAPLLAQLQSNFGKTVYASLGSLQMAAAWANDGKYNEAQAPLQWVIAHGQVENQGAARLRLADVLMQLGKKEDALKVLDTPTAHYESAFAGKKADLYLAAQDPARAREALNNALVNAKKATPTDAVAVQALTQKLQFLPQ